MGARDASQTPHRSKRKLEEHALADQDPELKEQVRQALLEVLAEHRLGPQAAVPAAHGAEITIHPGGQVTIRQAGTAEQLLSAPTCYPSCCIMCLCDACYPGPLALHAVSFSVEAEVKLAEVLETTGMSREQVVAHLFKEAIEARLHEFHAEVIRPRADETA